MRLILKAEILLVLLVIVVAVLEIVGAVVAVCNTRDTNFISTCGIGVSTCCTSFSGRGCDASASSRNKFVPHTFIFLIM